MGYLFQFLNVSFHPPGRDTTRGKEEIKKFIENLFMRLFAIKFHQYFNRGEERHILCYDKRTRRKVALVFGRKNSDIARFVWQQLSVDTYEQQKNINK